MRLGWATGQPNLQSFHWVDEGYAPRTITNLDVLALMSIIYHIAAEKMV